MREVHPSSASSIVLVALVATCTASCGTAGPPAPDAAERGSGARGATASGDASGGASSPTAEPAHDPTPAATLGPPGASIGAGSLGVSRLVVSGAGACALLESGRVRCFEEGAARDVLERAVDLSSDGNTTCAVVEPGDVWCWGARPGLDERTPPSSKPVRVAGLTGIADVELAYWNGSGAPWLCVVTTAGVPRCTCDRSGGCGGAALVPIAGAPRVKMASGRSESGCALTADRRVWCWSRRSNEPGAHVAGLSEVEDLVDYGVAYCARTADERVSCFGGNHEAELGRGYMTLPGDPETPPVPHDTPVALDVRAAALAPGLALTAAGGLVAWGDNDEGQRIPGGPSPVLRPTATDVVSDARVVAASSERACALRGDGVVACWGAPAPVEPARPHDLPIADAVSIAWARSHVCALRRSGDVACWGRRSGRLRRDEILAPRDVGAEGASEIAVSSDSVCVRSRGGDVRCWGGIGSSDGDVVTRGAESVGFVWDIFCVSNRQETRCTRPFDRIDALVDPNDYALGNLLHRSEPPKRRPAPTLQPAGPGGSKGWSIVRGEVCFLSSGSFLCGGAKGAKARPIAGVTNAIEIAEDAVLLSDGTLVSATTPSVRLRSSPIRTLVGAEELAIAADGRILTWSFRGQGSLVPRGDLVAIDDAVDMAGDGHASSFGCVVRRSGRVSCWGTGAQGEIGLGDRSLPRAVGTIAP